MPGQLQAPKVVRESVFGEIFDFGPITRTLSGSVAKIVAGADDTDFSG